MRGIAGEDHAAMDELFHPPALEFVERDPFELEIVVPEHARDPRPHVFRPLLDRGIGIGMSCRSIRQMSSGCRCSSAERPA